ncbi:GAF domain-containing protein [Microbacterium sp. W4I20]|uniref:sensor histidine kinase n=1 Tax=Microbacterium sp. W4I20 TaxID=3042262 RepID=UPI0027868973|nr:GAF domain-containing protein [Microbacterium sp. W4I20]MDQ0729202.1 signal transduction histidine kinase [Microbacterium sp. W4I20]
MPERSGPPDEAADAALAQRRLRDLLDANASIVERLDLEVVLRRIVEAAMRLVDAPYGALGVIDRDGGIERFIHVGMDAATVERIGPPPVGHGLLGAVITEHTPIRVTHLATDPRSTGFPEHHPPMDAFLGVPVRVGDHVYGNLYLTSGDKGPFTEEDERLVIALAATAGIAIENAHLYDIAKTREIWSETTADVMAAMLEVSDESVLEVIAEHAGALIDVDLVVVAVPHGDDDFRVTTVHGVDAASLRGRIFPAAGTLAARALATQRAASVGGDGDADADQAPVDWQPGAGPTVAIPLYSGSEPLGVLTLARRLGASAFTDADLDLAFAFAAQASVAIEVVRAREDRRRLETNRDRARIARDLHDHVIQRLFGAGLSLQAVSATVDATASAVLETQIDAIDAAIKDIRTVVFALGAGDRGSQKRTRDRLLDTVAEVSVGLSSTPRITFSGPLDSLVHARLADELVAVLRECLTNTVKHAHAHHVEVAAEVTGDVVVLTVLDDGHGIPAGARLSGLANITERAQLRGGVCTITSESPSGTRIEWMAPVSDGNQSGET